MPLIYETVRELPIDAEPENLAHFVEKIREIAYPRIHVRIEAADRRELARKLDDLNTELESRWLPTLPAWAFSRGVEGSLFDPEEESYA